MSHTHALSWPYTKLKTFKRSSAGVHDIMITTWTRNAYMCDVCRIIRISERERKGREREKEREREKKREREGGRKREREREYVWGEAGRG